VEEGKGRGVVWQCGLARVGGGEVRCEESQIRHDRKLDEAKR
jgi:hypothetical protein